jgi:primosomal protein N' (replication factor Y)
MAHKHQQLGLFGPDEAPEIASSEPARPSGQKVSRTAKAESVSPDQCALVRLAFDQGGDNVYDYAIPESFAERLQVGQRVRAPFGRRNRMQIGFCVAFPQGSDVKQVKQVAEIVDPFPLFDSDRMELARWISDYYGCPLGITLAAMVPNAVKKKTGLVSRTYVRLSPQGEPQEQPEQSVRLSSQGRTILEHLKLHAGKTDMLLEELLSQLQCTRGPVKTLSRAGLVQLIQKKEFTNHLKTQAAKEPAPSFELNEGQKKVLTEAGSLIALDSFNVLLLHGVTGSGKTEVYMSCIETVLRQGKRALVLVPEIAQTPQTLNRFRNRFGRVAVLHSALTEKQRHQQWDLITQGQADVVVGARSAVFAPIDNLGFIVVDEEHDPSYKQDSAPRYQGRDVAVKLAQIKNIPILLGSATPSLETWNNAQTKDHYHMLDLPQRVLDLPLPQVHIVDMRKETQETQNRDLISRALQIELEKCLVEKHQAILLLNRRGHSSYIFCGSCSFVLHCPNCDVSLTSHKKKEAEKVQSWIMCHHCLHASRVPKCCPVCSQKLNWLGPGTQKAEEELQQKFPAVRLKRMDSDAVRASDYSGILEEFGRGEIDILLGTQMIGKGLDYPNVNLVGVLHADTALSIPDFRSSERSFQLITQVAGRAGRASNRGRVIVQSFLPEEPAITLACKHDYLRFVTSELATRQRCQMPPYQRLAMLLLRDTKFNRLEEQGKALRSQIDQVTAAKHLQLKIRGPFPAPIARIDSQHRSQILLQAATATPIQALLKELRIAVLPHFNLQIQIDMDPINLM